MDNHLLINPQGEEDVPCISEPAEETKTVEGGDGGNEVGEQRNETTQRILNIMTNFLEGEVWTPPLFSLLFRVYAFTLSI